MNRSILTSSALLTAGLALSLTGCHRTYVTHERVIEQPAPQPTVIERRTVIEHDRPVVIERDRPVVIERDRGNAFVERLPDGTILERRSDGTLIERRPDGTVIERPR